MLDGYRSWISERTNDDLRKFFQGYKKGNPKYVCPHDNKNKDALVEQYVKTKKEEWIQKRLVAYGIPIENTQTTECTQCGKVIPVADLVAHADECGTEPPKNTKK